MLISYYVLLTIYSEVGSISEVGRVVKVFTQIGVTHFKRNYSRKSNKYSREQFTSDLTQTIFILCQHLDFKTDLPTVERVTFIFSRVLHYNNTQIEIISTVTSKSYSCTCSLLQTSCN